MAVPRRAAPPAVAAFRALYARAVSCPHLARGPGCCSGHACALGRGRAGWVVPQSDCFACPDLPPERGRD